MKLLPKQKSIVLFNDGKQRASWFALILNTPEGLQWIKNFKKKNPKCKIKLRTRHSNRRLAYKLAGKDYDHSYPEHVVPKSVAERFAMYIEDNKLRNENIKENQYFPKITKDGLEFDSPKVHRIWFDNGIKYCSAFSDAYNSLYDRYESSLVFQWSNKSHYWKIISYSVF